MPVYTVVGWKTQKRDPTISWFDAPRAMAAVDAGYATFATLDGWRPIAVFAGKHRAVASMVEVRARGADHRPAIGRTLPFTVVGFWRHSGESICRQLVGGDGIEAMLLALARLGLLDELTLTNALSGHLTPAITSENLPVSYGDRWGD